VLAKAISAAVLGVDAYKVEVEVDIAGGLPKVYVVGLPGMAVQESKERVRSAIKNAGYQFPASRLVINLAPADVRKEGPAFDLPIALAILAAQGIIPKKSLENCIVSGELALDGSIRSIRGAINIALFAAETNIKKVYAIGDCAEQETPIGQRRPIEAVWYTGRMMGETVAQTICGNRTEYKPGHWFNSAKFLDIEYQTYGWVWAQPKENEARFYWQHPTENKCIHINFDKNTRKFIGINTFGIRMRHAFFDKILNEQKSVEYVLEHLSDANFDPEFFRLYEPEIVDKFNKENGTNVSLKKKSWKRIFNTI